MSFWSKVTAAVSGLFKPAPDQPAPPDPGTLDRPARKSGMAAARPVAPPAPTVTPATAARPAPSRPAAAQPCPHGKRRREYCPICDPDGYRHNFGDWTAD